MEHILRLIPDNQSMQLVLAGAVLACFLLGCWLSTAVWGDRNGLVVGTINLLLVQVLMCFIFFFAGYKLALPVWGRHDTNVMLGLTIVLAIGAFTIVNTTMMLVLRFRTSRWRRRLRKSSQRYYSEERK
jgi:hypothetical protein